MAYGLKLPGSDLVKVPNSGGGADPTKLPLAGGNLSGLLGFTGTTHAGIRLNSLTTTQRDALTPAAGDWLLNTTLNQFQGYVSGAWASMATLGANIFTGATSITDTTASTSSITGALKVAGGVGIAGKLCVTTIGRTDGSDIYDGNNLTVYAANAGLRNTTGNLTLGNYTSNYVLTIREDVGLFASSTHVFGWTNGTSYGGTHSAWFKYGGAAACIQMGTDAASGSVVNQHLKACNGITSASVAGANLTISGGNGRGGAGGDLILASYTTAGSGVAGTLTTRWKMDAATGALLPGANATYNLGSAAAVLANIYSTDYYSGSTKVVGGQQAGFAAVSGSPMSGIDTIDLSGLTTIISNIQTAINTCRDALNAHGLTTTV